MKALAKDPSERFQSAAEMREALVSTLDHPRRQGWTAALTRPVATPRASETRRPAAAHTRRLIPRPGMGALSILALILVAFGVVAALSSLLNGPGRPPDEAQGVSATSTSGSPNAQPTQAESNQPVVAAAPTTAPEPRPTPRPADSPPPSAAQSGPATAAPAPPTQTPQSTAAQRAAPPAQAASAQAAPAAPPAPAAQPLAAAGPTQAVSRFYNAIAQQDFDRAAALWSPRMRSAYPPRENIVTRFADTRQLVVQRTDLISADESAGVATVAVDLLEVTSAGNRRWVGNWHLVRGSSGWLLDQPDLRAA